MLAVDGAPGVGKTTLLLHTALRACRPGRHRPLPVLLFLRDHVAAITGSPSVTLPDVLRGTLGRYRADEPAGWFEERLSGGGCVVLLDGLDEVAVQRDRRAVADWVERQIHEYPGNDWVVTSRPHGYLTARIDGATVLRVRRLTDEQVAGFLGGWYLALERAADRASDRAADRDRADRGPAAAERAATATAVLLDRLRRSPALYDLTANPMLLTMIANVHRYRGQLPDGRGHLYVEICEVMLGLRPRTGAGDAGLAVDKKVQLLQGVAFEMMTRRVRDLARADVLAAVRPALRRLTADLEPEDFLADVGENGLLVERENGLYSFAHQTFQEHLAAEHVRGRGLIDVLTEAVDDVWWRETTLLYALRSDADPIVRACLDVDTVTALSLAFDCAAQPSEIDPELRAGLVSLLGAAFDEDADTKRRLVMASVQVDRHLRGLTPSSDESRVCARPVPTGVFRLFLGDRPSQGSWWLDPGADRPVLGVHGRQAVAFVNWLNGVVASAAYRLPSRSELDDPVVARVLAAATAEHGVPVSAWVRADHEGGDPQLWTASDCPHPHAVGRDMVVRLVAEDVPRLGAAALARLLLARAAALLPALARAHLAALNAPQPPDPAPGRDLKRALDLAHRLDPGLDVGRAAALVPALAALATRAVHHGRERDRSFARDSSLDMARRYAGVRDTDGDAAHASHTARAGEVASAGDVAAVTGAVRDLADGLVRLLDAARAGEDPVARVLGLDAALSAGVTVARAVGGALRSVRGDDPARTLGDDRALAGLFDPAGALAAFTGPVLADAVGEALERSYPAEPDDEGAVADGFGRALVAASGLGDADRVPAPDTIADRVREAAGDGAAEEAAREPWSTALVARRLADVALPALTWQRPLDDTTAAAARLGALCLAAATGREEFRDIAAGVTLVQRRTHGLTPATETIIIALR